MELHERLLILHQPPARIAQAYAEFMKYDDEADRGQIRPALTALLKCRQQYQAQAERIAAEIEQRPAPWADFGNGITTQAQRDAWSAQAANDAEAERSRVEAAITALDALFKELCQALARYGLNPTGGQISELKRAGLPDAWRAALDEIKREHRASIPEAERLADAEAAAIYAELTRQGLISGPYAAFAYYLGQFTSRPRKAPAEALKWAGNKAEFAYFAQRFAYYTQGQNNMIREKALCLAFGFDDRQRENTIRPYLSDMHKPRTSGKIDAAFSAGERARAEAATTGETSTPNTDKATI